MGEYYHGDLTHRLLKGKALNGWPLFLLITLPLSVVMIVAMAGRDMSSAPDVQEMIGFSVRWAVPFIFLVTATSSLQYLFPGAVSIWLLRNRKYLGLCFAVAMAWQGAFIFMMSNVFRDYYFEEIYFFRDELEGSTGYIFLTAMVLTSFQFGRKHLTSYQWRLLHRSGLYFLWAYPFSVYWWNLSYYGNPEPIDYVFYWSGFAAFALRIVAWGRKRQRAARKNNPDARAPLPFRLAGGATIALGILVASTGLHWRTQVTDFLTAPAWSATLELWLPYWPFEPFLSLFIVGLGMLVATATPTSSDVAELAESAVK